MAIQTAVTKLVELTTYEASILEDAIGYVLANAENTRMSVREYKALSRVQDKLYWAY